jgi:exodeoxyribonuclease V beta subunit
VVFCPFLWLGTSRRPGKTEPIEYHEDGHAVVSFVPGDAAAESRQRIEVFAEQVRLIYVALTRAVCRTYLVAGNYLSGKSEIPCRTSALNWLIGGAGTGPGDWLDGKGPSLDAIESAWMQFAADAAPNVILSAIPVPETSAALAARRPDRLLRARPAERRVTDSWRIESFTSLAAAAGSARAEQAADHDERLALQARTAEPPAELPEHDPLRFPRGPRAGVLLHAALEHADFAQPGSWGGAIAAAIARAAAGGDRDRAPVADVSLTEILRVILHNVLTTDLDGCGLRLEVVTNEMRLSELGFVLSVRGASAARLASAIEAAGFPACAMSFETIEGYLNGAIDCVFRHEGRYYLADWKSNFLGWMPADYRKAALDQVMRQEDYSLQAAIYSVALHRYLRRRLAGYDPDAHFGGVYYLFARAVRPDWRDDQGRPTGVWSLGLGAAQLDSLDACFG